jgi:hypothetical protein
MFLNGRINGIECKIFYDERVSPEKTPQGYPNIYHVRHDQYNWTCPIALEKYVLVNFYGTVFMKEKLDFGASGYIEIKNFKIDKELLPFQLSSSIFQRMFCI